MTLSHFKKGDTVMVISGKDKGVKSKILKVMPSEGKVVVEKVNIVKRHQRPTRNFPGGIIEKPAPLNLSKVMLVCPRCGKPVRVGRMIRKDKTKVRVCKKCKESIEL